MVTGAISSKEAIRGPRPGGCLAIPAFFHAYPNILLPSNVPPDGAVGIITLTKEQYKWYKTQLSALINSWSSSTIHPMLNYDETVRRRILLKHPRRKQLT
jgi:hypothetical protein